MTKIFIILVIAFSFEAIGIITLKRGLDRIGPHYTERKATLPLWQNILKLVGEWFTNKDVLLGLLLETIFFILLQYLLGARDVSYVWPLTALSFVMTTLAANDRKPLRQKLTKPVRVMRLKVVKTIRLLY